MREFRLVRPAWWRSADPWRGDPRDLVLPQHKGCAKPNEPWPVEQPGRGEAEVVLVGAFVCVSFSSACYERRPIIHATSARPSISDCHCDAQEGRWNGGCALFGAFVFAVEQIFQLFLQVGSFPIFFGGVESVHRWPVIFPEFTHEASGFSTVIKGKRVPFERNILFRNSSGGKSLDDVALDTPAHRADKTLQAAAACRRS